MGPGLSILYCRGGRNRTYTNGFGDRCTTTIRRPRGLAVLYQKETKKPRHLFALGMGSVLFTEATVFGKRKFLFYFLLVALGVVRDAPAEAAFELHHRIFDLAHTSNF